MTSARLLVLLVPLALSIAFAVIRPDVRRSMLWAGLLAVPVLLTSPLTFNALDYPIGLIRLVTLFSFGALAAALYEVVFSKYFQLKRQSRRPLLWLIAGPVIFLIGTMITGQVMGPLIFVLLLEIGFILFFRRDLVWDVVFSGFAMAILYVVLLLILVRGLGTPLAETWLGFADPSGLTFFGVPFEEVLLVALFGALWGPMYPAYKDLKLVP